MKNIICDSYMLKAFCNGDCFRLNIIKPSKYSSKKPKD